MSVGDLAGDSKTDNLNLPRPSPTGNFNPVIMPWLQTLGDVRVSRALPLSQDQDSACCEPTKKFLWVWSKPDTSYQGVGISPQKPELRGALDRSHDGWHCSCIGMSDFGSGELGWRSREACAIVGRAVSDCPRVWRWLRLTRLPVVVHSHRQHWSSR